MLDIFRWLLIIIGGLICFMSIEIANNCYTAMIGACVGLGIIGYNAIRLNALQSKSAQEKNND